MAEAVQIAQGKEAGKSHKVEVRSVKLQGSSSPGVGVSVL